MAKEAVQRGVKIVYTGDDFAYVNGPLMSPDTFREIFYPRLKRVMQGYKELGLYVIKHTDGNIMPLIDMIIDSGIDCLDPIDPVAGMDLSLIKEKYGQRVAIKGNVDCSQTLTFGSTEETIEEAKKCIKIGAPGGGYIFSSSNSIHSSVKPDNYKAMLETLKKYGSYPINL
jgi:uroporphyrinogen decarboxylase